MKIFKIAFAIFFLPVAIFGWSKSTHKQLSSYTCFNSKLIKENLIWKLSLDMGAAQPLTVENETKTVAGWIYDGAEKEDEGNYPIWDRSARHFHNPLLAFNEAGLNRLLQHFQSSIVWAQDGVEQAKFAEGNMSWQKAKEYFYFALISDTEEKRHLNLGLLFKGLGHQMHLVQDMSNPEHTRNDNHPFVTIESWAEEHSNDLIDGFCQSPLFPNVDLKTLVYDSSTGRTLSPIARLTDSDVYMPENPIPSAIMQQGLSEYSNANFVSDDTIFSSDFPHPSSSNIDITKVFIETNPEYKPDEKGAYLPKINDGDPITHFLRLPYLKKYTDEIVMKWSYLDGLCYKDIASMLIPRAVGYSSALLDYFFRGEIEVTLPDSLGIYSFCTDSNEGFKKFSLMVKNVTRGNEEMTNGEVSLVLSYRLGSGPPFVPNPPRPEEERYFKVFNCGVKAIPRDTPVQLDVDLSGNPLPYNAMDVTLTVVFKGDLGAELNDAVAIGFKDISEPTPVDLFNDTDKICFHGNRLDWNDPLVVNEVDKNHDNYIDCNWPSDHPYYEYNIGPQKLKLKGAIFNGQKITQVVNSWHISFEDTPVEFFPGTSYRLYVLADENKPFSISAVVHNKTMPDLQIAINPNQRDFYPPINLDGSLPGVKKVEARVFTFNSTFKNKLVWDGARYNQQASEMKPFRGIIYFAGVAFGSGEVNPSCDPPEGMFSFIKEDYVIVSQ